MHYFGVKTLSETPFPPPLMHPGDGARYIDAATSDTACVCPAGTAMTAGTGACQIVEVEEELSTEATVPDRAR